MKRAELLQLGKTRFESISKLIPEVIGTQPDPERIRQLEEIFALGFVDGWSEHLANPDNHYES